MKPDAITVLVSETLNFRNYFVIPTKYSIIIGICKSFYENLIMINLIFTGSYSIILFRHFCRRKNTKRGIT